MTQMPNAVNKAGYCSSIWFSGLYKPRGLLVLSNNDVIVIEQDVGRVTLLWEKAPGQTTHLMLAQVNGLNHGVAYNNGFLYATSETTLYRWPFTVGARVALGAYTVMLTGMPTNKHTTRTLLFGSNPNILYLTCGSGANIDTNPDRAGVYTFDITKPLPLTWADKTTISHGNRNEVGIRFDANGQLWGVENGPDDLNRADLGGDIHQDNPGEEINALGGGKFYGYPYCFSQYGTLPTGTPRNTQWVWPDFLNNYTDAWCRDSSHNQAPAYLLPAHTAPMDIIFKGSQNFPGIATGDAFVSQHGSWDRTVPQGYKVSHVTFTAGKPTADEPFLSYVGPGDYVSGWHRPVGLGWAKCSGVDCLLISSDATGVIIAMTATSSCTCIGGQNTPAPTPKPTPAPTTKPTPAPTPKPTPSPSCSASAVGTGTGLTGDYYNGDTSSSFFVTYALTRVDPTVNFNWALGSPATGVNPDNFSVRWTGQVQPRYSGTYTFYTSVDDGARLYVNNVLVINSWVSEAQVEKSGTISLTAGTKYDIVLEYFEGGYDAVIILEWSHACQPKQVIPQTQLYQCRSSRNAAGNGILGYYFSDQNLTTLKTTRHDTYINGDWATGGPPTLAGQVDHFSIRWVGLVQPRFSGQYTFYADSDDGARIFVNGQEVVNAWIVRGFAESAGTINLVQGKNYSVVYEYFESTGNSRAQMNWANVCEPKEVVPTSQLFLA